MLRQHSHPPAAPSALSPTTTAATAGIRLNDPALRNVAVSTSSRAAPNNNVASTASINPNIAHGAGNASGVENIRSFHGDDGLSTMTNSRGKLPPFTVVTTAATGDKENNHNSKLPSYQDSKPAATPTERDHFCETDSQQQQPMMDLDEYESEQMMADEVMSNKSTSTPRNNESMVGEIQLPYNNDENHEMTTLDEFNMDNDDDGDNDDDEGSDCSGNTVVAMERPPTGLTEVELNKYYWEICYGPGHAVPPPTIVKCFPTKSW